MSKKKTVALTLSAILFGTFIASTPAFGQGIDSLKQNILKVLVVNEEPIDIRVADHKPLNWNYDGECVSFETEGEFNSYVDAGFDGFGEDGVEPFAVLPNPKVNEGDWGGFCFLYRRAGTESF